MIVIRQIVSHFHRGLSFLQSIEASNLYFFRIMKKMRFEKIKVELDKVHGTSALVFKTVCNWVNDFKYGLTFTIDEHRSERPLEMNTPEMIDKIHNC